MRREARNRILMLGQEVTAEAAVASGRRRWLMIRLNGEGGLMLVQFDVEGALDPDRYPAPTDILNRQRWDFGSLEEALRHLGDIGFDTDAFDAPWKMDYPL